MSLDRVRNAREIRGLADLVIVVAIACLAAGVFEISILAALVVAFSIFRPFTKKEALPLFRRAPVWLAILTLCLLSVGANWSVYSRGVSEGYDAAAHATRKEAANKSPLPTPASVTPAANAAVAPPSGAVDR